MKDNDRLKTDRLKTWCIAAAALGSVLAAGWLSAQSADRTIPPERAAVEIGTDAYIYGYPLVTMEMTRRVATNVAAPSGMKAPMGRFANAREYPPASFRDVTAPNA